jgi:hypothetical protein
MEQDEWDNFKKELRVELVNFQKNDTQEHRTRFIDFLNAFLKVNNICMKKMDDCASFSKIIIADKSLSLRDRAIFRLSQFLWIYEVNYMACINTLCFLLVCNHHDLIDNFGNYANSIEDIEEMNGSPKIKFLFRHKFDIMKRPRDAALRNGIAHSAYSIDDNGTIFIKNNRIDVLEQGQELITFCEMFWRNFCSTQNEINEYSSKQHGDAKT